MSLNLRLPAAILRFWDESPGADLGLAEAELYLLSRGHRGIQLLAPGILAITPESGDPAIFDTALHLARRLRLATMHTLPALRLLILPAELILQDGSRQPAIDGLAANAPTWFPNLEPGAIHLSGWVLRMLERPCQAEKVISIQGPADQSLPVFKAGPPEPEIAPWRNPEILNRRLRPVARIRLTQAARELIDEPAWRVEGPLGCGKSHFVHQFLAGADLPRLWLRGEPMHRSSGSLARKVVTLLASAPATRTSDSLVPRLRNPALLERLRTIAASDPVEELAAVIGGLSAGLDRPFCLVLDDLENCGHQELELLRAALSLPELGESFRLLLVGRGTADLPAELGELPSLQVGPFSEAEMSELSPQLFEGLSLPAQTQSRLQIATQGCPFALEEAMIALIRERELRRVYGSFFFAGQDSAGFRPSPRLLCHLQAEAYRLGLETPLHLLALVETGLPPGLLDNAVARLGARLPDDWESRGRTAGLLVDKESPWGPGVVFNCSAYGTTLAEGIIPESMQELRTGVGTTLAKVSQDGKALWESYCLLRGTPAAIEPLMRTLASSYASRIPRAALMEVLLQELYRHRERRGDDDTELQLLWKLLPLARKLGRLNEVGNDLQRAVELARDQPRQLLAIAGLKAEMDQDAGRYQEAESTIRLALAAAKSADQRRQALLLIQLGRLYLEQERFDEAKELFEKLAATLDQSGLEALAASCRYYLGNIAFHEERFDDALDLHAEALERRRRQNLKRVAGNSLTAIGAVYLAVGNFPHALRSYREAQELLDSHGGDADRAFPLLGLGRALNYLGDYSAASRALREALALREGKDDIAGEAVARLAVAENHLYLGQLEQAQREATKALFQLNLLSRKTLEADSKQLLGRIQTRLRQLESARNHLSEALEQHRERGHKRSAAFDLAYLLELSLAAEKEDEVSRYTRELEQAVQGLTRTELVELLHYRLYQGLSWLRSRDRRVADPRPSLERAYREMFRKASHLDPEMRHHFLFQVSEYREIAEAAARAGFAPQSGV